MKYAVATRPVVDIREDQDQYIIEAELPGFNEELINLSVKDNLLTIEAEEEKEEKEVLYLIRERRFRSFKRSFVLPKDADSKAIHAEFENGLLNLSIPKKEEAKPISIKIEKRK